MNKITLEISSQICLNDLERRKAFEFTNLHFYGESLVPLSESVSEEHKDAHHSICMCRNITILVDIDEKGKWDNIRVKKEVDIA